MLAATVEPGFAEAVGMTHPVRLRVEHATAGVLAEGEIDLPFAVVGSHPECEISLNDSSLPDRAAALQVIDGRVVLFPFQTLTPTPLAADVTWRVGEFNVSWTNDHAATPNFDPLRPISSSPRVILDHRTDAGKVEAIPLTRRIGFIGRSLGCAVRFDAVDVAEVHAYLLMAGNTVWVIDLLSASGIWVNDRRVRTARLRDGDELRIGSHVLTARYDLWGEVLPTSPAEPGGDPSAKPQPVIAVSQPAAEDESTDLVLLTPVPVVPALPTVALPPQADANTVALFQYVAAMQGQMMAEFRQSMDDMVNTVGRMHQQQMEAMRSELNRLAELNSELQKLQLPVAAPLSLPAPSPAAALYQSIDPDELPPMTEESASRHQWVAARLAEIEAERGGIWDRIRGMFGKTTQAV